MWKLGIGSVVRLRSFNNEISSKKDKKIRNDWGCHCVVQRICSHRSG